MKNTYQIIEDNGGGLHLFVFDADGNVIDGITNLEYAGKGEYNQVREGLAADPAAEIAGWDGHMEDAQVDYLDITGYEYGWTVVCDNGTLYPDRMGAAAERYFSDNKQGRPPMYGEPMTQTAIWLPSEMYQYLTKQGNMSEYIRSLIQTKMDNQSMEEKMNANEKVTYYLETNPEYFGITDQDEADELITIINDYITANYPDVDVVQVEECVELQRENNSEGIPEDIDTDVAKHMPEFFEELDKIFPPL